jgi:hypothetical protein
MSDAAQPDARPRGAMPAAIRLFLAYALVILAVLAVTLPRVIEQAVAIPISPIGVLSMALLAYTIFTVTLVLQRKEAARGLALGLATLSLPAIPLAFFSFAVASAGIVAAAICMLLSVALFRGLSGPAARAYLSEP